MIFLICNLDLRMSFSSCISVLAKILKDSGVWMQFSDNFDTHLDQLDLCN